MAADKIVFSIANDFPNGKVNPTTFDTEIRESEIASQFDGIIISGADCDVWFSEEQSEGNIAILGSLVAAHQGADSDVRTKQEIMKDIFYSVTSQEQSMRLIAALDAYPSFEVMIGQTSYDLARQRAATALSAEVLTQDDYDLIDSKLPGYVAPE